MRIALNLATAPLENHRRFWAGALLVGAAGLAVFLVLGMHTLREYRATRELRDEISTLQREIREMRAERKELEAFFADPATARALDRAAFLNALIRQRGFQWTQIFMDLERLLPAGVRVISITPRMAEDFVEVKLSVGAVSDEDKVKFLMRLNESENFRGYRVLAESRPRQAGELDRVLLDLVARYERPPR